MRPQYYSIMNQPQPPVAPPPVPIRRPYSEADCRIFYGSSGSDEIPYLIWHDNFLGQKEILGSNKVQMDRRTIERLMVDFCHKWSIFDYVVWARILGCGDGPPSPALSTHPTAQKHVALTRDVCTFMGAFWQMYCSLRESPVGQPALVKAVADVHSWQWQAGSGMMGPGKVARTGWQHNYSAFGSQAPRLARTGGAPAQPHMKAGFASLLTPHAMTISVCTGCLKFSHLTSFSGYSGRFRGMAAVLLPPLQALENLQMLQDPITLGGALSQTLPIPSAQPDMNFSNPAAPTLVPSNNTQFLGQAPPGAPSAFFWPQTGNANAQASMFNGVNQRNAMPNEPPRAVQQKAAAAGLQGFGVIPASIIASTGAANSQTLAMVSQTQHASGVNAPGFANLDNLPPPPGLGPPRPSHQRANSMSRWQQEVQALAVQRQQEAAAKLQESAARMLAEEQARQQAMYVRAELHDQAVRKWKADQDAERLAHERASLVAFNVVFLIEQCQKRYVDGVAAALQAINAFAYASAL
ncbi:hypothetical protein HDZ31DRAFT_44728 [Schizophyllum fasciatum]